MDGNWVSFFFLFLPFNFLVIPLTFFHSSTSGFVNIYDSDSFSVHHGDSFRTESESGTPKLVKALGHLTTPISTLRFNHDSQILAMASKDKKDAMRLVGFLGFIFLFFSLLHGSPRSAVRLFTNFIFAGGQDFHLF